MKTRKRKERKEKRKKERRKRKTKKEKQIFSLLKKIIKIYENESWGVMAG